MAGKCVSQAIAASCLPTSSLAVLVGATGVTAYVPRATWTTTQTGVERVALEGSAEPATIPTPNAVNSCAANWVTGEVVCTSNGTDVYLIQGTTLTATLTSGATALQDFSGGTCDNCGVAIDSSTNQAIISVGLLAPPSLTLFQATGGFQFLDLATNTFQAPISTGLPPSGSTLPPERFTSEDITVDPFRHFVLSPNEQGDYEILQTGASPSLFDQQFESAENEPPEFDSSAEDCSTGIALATDELAGTITLVDLTQAAFTPGSPNGTWSAPTSTEVLPELLGSEATGLAVAPGSHLGLISPEGPGPSLVAFQLPSTSGSGTPALVDYAAIVVPNAGGAPWTFGADPHTVTAYTSPSTNRAMGVIDNNATASGVPTFVAVLDLQAILGLPRVSGSHNVDPTYDLVAHGVVRFIAGACPEGGFAADPNNCGACGNVCPEEPNSAPTCPFGTCEVACTVGFGNCDGIESNGCEANLLTDPANCGGCGVSCAAPNATGACTFGQCSLVCSVGFSDCDGIESNGCETPGPCESPSVSLTGPTSVAAGAATPYVAGGTDPVPGGTLSFTWSEVSGPGEVTFSPASGSTTSADFSAAGTYVVEVTANDGFATTNVEQTVSVTLVNQPPVVTVGADQTLNSPTLSTTLTGSATDDGLPKGATLSSVWSLVSGPVDVTIASPMQSGVPEPGPLSSSTQVTFSYPGTYVFQLAVSDTQLVGVATETVTVNPPPAPTSGTDGGTAAAPSAPTVAIGGVTDDQEVTQPTQILGTVSDGAWVLQSRLGGRDDVQTPWTVMASGIGAVNGGAIATFDPTLLLNGIYTLLLSSTNSVGSSSTSVSLSVDARMKVGLFTLTFTDLSTAVGGLPLTVTRTYDSRDKTIGDFGFGWKLGISDVRVEKSGKTGAFWQQQFFDETFFSEFCLSPSQAASVAITFPSGRQYRFTPQANPPCQAEVEDTAPDITWVSTSDPNNPTITLLAAGETSMFANDVGNGITELQDDNGDIWDPRQFTLTIEDGSVWQIDQDLGVTAIRDLNGNTLTITPNGVVQSSGKSVTFQRDIQGRITSITDPNGASMTYAYDGDGDLATYTDRLSNVTQFSYAANHYLTQIQDPLGRLPVRNVYDADGRLLSTTDAAGNTVNFSPNLAANLEQVTDRLGNVTLYAYDNRGDVTQKVDATGAVWNYTFDIFGNTLTATDPLGNTTTSTYDGANNLLTRTDPLGNVTTKTYNGFKELLTTTDPIGHVTTNAYDGSGNLLTTTDPLGNAKRYTYDGLGDQLSATDALGHLSTSTYDIANNVTQTTDAAGQTTSYTYDANGRKTSQAAPRANYLGESAMAVTSYQYDASGNLTRTAGAYTVQLGELPAIRSTTYTATGKRATDTDEIGRVTTYTYDALDRLVTTTRPDGTTQTQTYDAENHRISSTDAAGNTTLYAYDPVGRLIRTTSADGSSTNVTYDAAGHPTQTVDELGHVRWTSYDAAGRAVGTTDPLGSTTHTIYDAAGNRTSVSDGLGHVTSFAYDAANRLIATTYPDGTADSTTYDADGRMTFKIDTLGRVTQYGYDAVGRLLTVQDASGNLTQYTYNGFGERLTQTDANKHTTNFTIDLFAGRETGRILPDGSTLNLVYDAAGQLVQRSDFAGRVTNYTYDPLGRVLTRTYPDSSVVSFTYTPDGQRASETDARGTTTYAFDARRRPVQMTYPDGRALTYGYDAHGDRTSITATLGTQSWTTTTAYDADGRPTRIEDPLARTFALTYDANGNRTSIAYPNSTTTTYAYDPLNRLTQLTTTQGADASLPEAIQSYAYTLNAAGQRTQITEADGTVRNYAYDSIDRLTNETVTGPLTYAKTFTYDPVGNRQNQTTTGAGADTDNYSYDTRDRLTSETNNTTSYSYDPNGNVTSKSGEASYSWDFENRLTTANMTSGATVAHEYDPDGNRVQTTVTSSGGTAMQDNLLVDTTGALSQVVAESDGSGNLTALYVRVGDELLEVMRPGATTGTWTTRFIHHDGLGSVRALTDETGTTTDTRAYEAFGTKNVEAGNDPLAYGFAGEPFEPTSLLAYHRARWMDARVGRFAGMDPLDGNIRLPVTLQRYVYVTNNPVSLIDPRGKDPDLVSISVSVDISAVEATTATESELAAGQAIVLEAQASEGTAVVEEAAAEIAAEATSPAAEAAAENAVTLQGTLRTTATVAQQLAGARNFIPVQAILAAIAAGTRIPDPQGVANYFLYTAQAAFNGGQGILEVLVDESTWTIAHVLYISQ
jgi:RHS repeat-associated protein